jgi:hypothetical protein
MWISVVADHLEESTLFYVILTRIIEKYGYVYLYNDYRAGRLYLSIALYRS